MSARSILSAFCRPVHPATRAHLDRIRAALPAYLHGPEQMYGRHTAGCGATIGAMPRCDFACSGCYLGREANRTPPRSVAELRGQLEAIRGFVGRWGNVQLTDGEVTLRPVAELLALLAHARELELIPMLMTHGERLRRDPALLERLVVEGGLREVSIHVDTTQRGRRERAFDCARTEAELDPLRDEFAELFSGLRRRTGIAVRAAMTVTVTAANLAGVADVTRWVLRNADVFRVLSYQPAAQVGRTEQGLGGRVRVDELWEEIARGLGQRDTGRLDRGRLAFGHADCTRCVMGWARSGASGRPEFHTWRNLGDPLEERLVAGFFERFAGVSLRADGRAEAAARIAGLIARAPLFVGAGLPRYAWRVAGRIEPGRALRLLGRLATGAERLRPLALVSHHFMDADELGSPAGREREAACTFRVPHEGRMVSMCAVNAVGLRDEHYAELSGRRLTSGAAR